MKEDGWKVGDTITGRILHSRYSRYMQRVAEVAPELAKELEMTSKELLAYLATQGLKAGSHMSGLQDTVAQILRDRLPKKLGPRKPAAEAAKAKGASNGDAGGGASTTERGRRGEARTGDRDGVEDREYFVLLNDFLTRNGVPSRSSHPSPFASTPRRYRGVNG